MTLHPPFEKIQQIREVLGLSEAQAVILLKKYNNDTERAIGSFFEDPEGSLRDDVPSTGWEQSYQDNIPYEDDTSTGALPAMSRPPSRADRIKDLTLEHAQASAAVNKPQEQDEDAELQRAIKMSLGQDAGDQENGVAGTGQQFGLTTKTNHDPEKWSLVPHANATATSRELIDHPPPSKRRRVEGQPAFLRGSKETRYLGPMLTILHGIPLARQALLFPSLEVLAYGYNPDWWKGTTDENRKSLSVQTSQTMDKARLNFIAEVQCLMAFLDNTKRAYGSVDALADLYAFRTFQAESPFTQFLETWRATAMGIAPNEPFTQIFSSTAMKSMSMDSAPISKDLVALEPQVNRSEGQLLVDLLDNTVWNDNTDFLDDVWISQFAEIFTIHNYDPGQKDEGLLLTPPAVWFPDRYMWHCREQTRKMREESLAVRSEMNGYSNLQRKYQALWGPGNKAVQIRDTLEAASKSSQVIGDSVAAGSDERIEVNELKALEPEIQSILEKIDQKLAALEERKLELYSQMQKISRALTSPSSDPSKELVHHKYVLQGVSTKPNITYLRRPNSDLLGLGDGDEFERSEWQWWRVTWEENRSKASLRPPMVGPLTQAQAEASHPNQNGDTASQDGDSKAFAIVKVSEQDVIEAAETEHNSVVLVYANEHAMNFRGGEISGALRHFISQDNVMFERECQKENMGSQPDLDQDVPFENVSLDDPPDAEHIGREMTPMSMNSHRDEDGQPSPKRPKSGSDEDWKIQGELPPSYEETFEQSQTQEIQKNKIGIYADQLLEKYGSDGLKEQQEPVVDVLQFEHSKELPR